MIIAPIGLSAVIIALGWVFLIGLRQRDVSIVVNALVSLVAVAIPLAVDVLISSGSDAGSSSLVELSVLIGSAVVLHMLGMIGWYDRVWWWDHVTHTASAALVAAIVYASLLVVDTPVAVGPKLLTVAFTVLAGVVWELVEWALRLLSEWLGIERVVTRYGRFDTPLDVLFDFIGAVLVVAADLRVLVPVFGPGPAAARLLLSGLLGVIVVGLAVSTVIVVYSRLAW